MTKCGEKYTFKESEVEKDIMKEVDYENIYIGREIDGESGEKKEMEIQIFMERER